MKGREEMQKLLSKDRSYYEPRNEIIQRFNNYDKLTKIEKDNLWNWLYSYLMKINWTRNNAYYFYHDFVSDKSISENAINDSESFYSMLIGNGIPTKEWLRFNGEPEDPYELREYIWSEKWLK